MKFDRTILFLFFMLSLVIGVFAQDVTKPELKASKFAEFGKMSQAGVKEKMDNFHLELARNPTSQGYIINYGSPKAIAARRKQLVRSISWLSLDPSRITLVDGPPEKTIRTVMSIVPPGATPPMP